jgi:hypothetical protein
MNAHDQAIDHLHLAAPPSKVSAYVTSRGLAGRDQKVHRGGLSRFNRWAQGRRLGPPDGRDRQGPSD